MLDVGWLNIGFIALTIFELAYFWWVSGKNNRFLIIASSWLILQAIVASTGFYQQTDTMPPRLVLVFIPVILIILILGLSKKTAGFRNKFDLQRLHYIHIIRIPVEVFFLYGLYQYGLIARELTFDGNNWDIISGVSMPLVALLFWKYRVISKKLLVAWNVLCFGILLVTISQAILSAPFPFQMLSLEQPTVAVFYFPFIWLPAFVAPLVLLSHLISIKELIGRDN